jgi:hypothetical protein
MVLRHDPAYDIRCSPWDMFMSWEWDIERRAGYLGYQKLDRNWV